MKKNISNSVFWFGLMLLFLGATAVILESNEVIECAVSYVMGLLTIPYIIFLYDSFYQE